MHSPISFRLKKSGACIPRCFLKRYHMVRIVQKIKLQDVFFFYVNKSMHPANAVSGNKKKIG